MQSDFKKGDIVCLRWDEQKRFIVMEETDIANGSKIVFKYFNESTGKLCNADIPKEYLRRDGSILNDNAYATDK